MGTLNLIRFHTRPGPPANDDELGFGPGGEQVTEYSVSSGTSTWVHTNAYASGTLLATYNGANTFFDLTDWLGTKRVEVAAGGGCASAFVSLPFGNTANDNSSYTPTALPGYSACGDATEQHFTGKERDAESGNDYFGARYYASTMGRFLSPDPKAASGHPSDPQTWNRYSYGANNPLTFVDPDGKEPLPSSWHQFFNAFYRSDFSRVNVQSGWLGNHVTPGGADAMTIGRVVFLSASFAKEYADRTQNAIIVTGHELSHVEDYSSEGITNFLLQYAGAYLYNRSQGQDDYDAYRNIPTEFIASLNEGDIAAFLKGHGSILQKLENNQTLSPEDIAKILLWELQQYQQQQQQQQIRKIRQILRRSSNLSNNNHSRLRPPEFAPQSTRTAEKGD